MVNPMAMVIGSNSRSGKPAALRAWLKMQHQPTFTTKRNQRGEDIGTGLGLTIVKSFVETNTGGTIIAKQRGEMGGAVLIIRVPRSTKPAKKEVQT